MMQSSYVSRINQIDAAQLDSEIYKILKIQTQEITKLCRQEIVEEWQPEMDAILKIVIWYFSLGNGKSTFGQRLLNLNYANLNGRKAIFFLILNVIPVYVQDKFANRGRIVVTDNNGKLRNCLETIINVFHLMSFFNLLAFLHRGTQPSVVERVLGVSSVNSMKHRPRQIGYSYMTRELLWHGLMELFSIGLPMINFHCVKRAVVRFFTRKGQNENMGMNNLRLIMDNHTRCPYCNESPILPRHAECKHVYCYYCIQAHFAAVNTFQCLTCGTELHSENTRVYLPNSKPNALTLIDEEFEN